MKICEEFNTIQGEGKYLGVPSYFIRTTGCNLRCAWKNKDETVTICDTPFSSFSAEKGYELSLEFNSDGKYKPISHTRTNHIVITGGEPLIQKDIESVCRQFVDNGYKVTVESNGTVYKDLPGVFMSISPKLKSSYAQTVEAERDLHAKNNHFVEAISKYIQNNDYQLKFVYNELKDIMEVDKLVERLKVPANRVYLMPQGITKEQFQQKQVELFKLCIKFGFNYTPRMHIDVFGNKRGV